MVEVKRVACEEADAPSAKRPSRGSGGLEEDLEAEVDAEQDLAEDDFDAMMLDDGIELQLGEAGRNWERPEPAPHNPKKDKLGSSYRLEHCLALLLALLISAKKQGCYSFSAAGCGLHHWASKQRCPCN